MRSTLQKKIIKRFLNKKMTLLEKSNKWQIVYMKMSRTPFKAYDCPFCSRGKLEVFIIPTGGGVSVSIQCNVDPAHQTHVNTDIFKA